MIINLSRSEPAGEMSEICSQIVLKYCFFSRELDDLPSCGRSTSLRDEHKMDSDMGKTFGKIDFEKSSHKWLLTILSCRKHGETLKNVIGLGRQGTGVRQQELTMDDLDLERLRRGRFQRGRVQRVIRAVEVRRKGQATVKQQKGWRIWNLTNVSQVRADQQSECGREVGRDFAHAVWRGPLWCHHNFWKKDHDLLIQGRTRKNLLLSVT